MPKLVLIFATLSYVALPPLCATAQNPPKCPKGYQPYGERCVTQRMADYVTCLEASGANHQEITEEVNQVANKQVSGEAKGAGSGVVAKGSGSLVVNASSEKELVKKIQQKWYSDAMKQCANVLDPPRRKPSAAGTRDQASHFVVDGNIVENLPNKLEVQDPGTTFTNNTVRGMDADIKHGALADNNDFEGRGGTTQPPKSEGKGADPVKIWAAQVANVYKCTQPCGERGPYPDSPIEGLPPNLPLAKATHGSSRFVADELSTLIDEGYVIMHTFFANNDMEALSRSQREWQIKIETIMSNLDPGLGEALDHVRSGQFAESSSRNRAGINICKSIAGKIDVLTIYQNQLRGVGN
jgi:hypothetical protein